MRGRHHCWFIIALSRLARFSAFCASRRGLINPWRWAERGERVRDSAMQSGIHHIQMRPDRWLCTHCEPLCAGASHKGHLFRLSLSLFADFSFFFLIGMEFKGTHPGGVTVNYTLCRAASCCRFFFFFFCYGRPGERDRLWAPVYVQLVKRWEGRAKVNCCLKSHAQHAWCTQASAMKVIWTGDELERFSNLVGWKQMACFLLHSFSVISFFFSLWISHSVCILTISFPQKPLLFVCVPVSVPPLLSLAPSADCYSCFGGSLSPRAQRVQYLVDGGERKWGSSGRGVKKKKTWRKRSQKFSATVTKCQCVHLIIDHFQENKGCQSPALLSIRNMRLPEETREKQWLWYHCFFKLPVLLWIFITNKLTV